MLEIKKLRSELLRVVAAKAEMDYQIEQKLDDIERLKKAMETQEKAEASIKEKLLQLGEK